MNTREPSIIRVLAANIKDALADPDRSDAIVQTIAEKNPTVAVLSEAYAARDEDKVGEALKRFADLGYQSAHVAENIDPQSRPDRHGLMVLGLAEHVQRIDTVDLIGRRALSLLMRDPSNSIEYRFVGRHGDDRSEARRVADESVMQARIGHLGVPATYPTIYAGDLNTMDPAGLTPRLLRGTAPLFRGLSAFPPDPEQPPETLGEKMGRFVSLEQRLAEMAIGGAYRQAEDAGFMNTDERMRPTMVRGPIRVKLDHIFVGPEFETLNAEVYDPAPVIEPGGYVPVSDHRAILADVRLRRSAR